MIGQMRNYRVCVSENSISISLLLNYRIINGFNFYLVHARRGLERTVNGGGDVA